VPRLAVGPLLSADMLRAFQDAVRALREGGVRCVEVELPDLDLLGRMSSLMLGVESTAVHREWLRSRADEYGRQVRRRLSRGLFIAGMDYYDALRLRGPMLRRFMERTLAGADALLLPTMTDVAPRVADTIGDDETRLEQAFSALSSWTRGINYLGLPALSVPAGRGQYGLPLAVQFVGAPLGEDRILALGQVVEQHGPYQKSK
jgi:aspartyl-tRNA(Asn)/glutamyl-tRNA(Gln) amidotransferase subunit A